MTVRSDRKGDDDRRGGPDFTVAIEISDWPVADARRPRLRVAAIDFPVRSCHGWSRSCQRD